MTAANERGHAPEHLGDFKLRPRVLVITACALPVGAAGAGAAWLLLNLIALITNLIFLQRIGFELVPPAAGNPGPAVILLAPVLGGLVTGLMARFGSEQIRGHGMPEAIEAILLRRSRVRRRVALLKPASSAVVIGTGGPFGAEGPIIMTGGAVGSIFAQGLRLTADERKALMVGGAAAGMAATFNAPLASVLLAVELLLFEWRPRSFLPVTAAVVVATLLRHVLIGSGPIFPADVVTRQLDWTTGMLCIAAGCIGALLAVAVTKLVYFSEDTFEKLPIHWMWWPAIGGLIIGIGGLIEPRALGVGYRAIEHLLTGGAALSLVVGLLIVKSLIWGLSLGSGTSGGVLAPVFLMGASLGALEATFFPYMGEGFWALVGLAAVVGGVMRSPFTGVVFSLELTHAWDALLGLLVASAAAYCVSLLLLKRSVLTEKIARHGYHLSREYEVDPLEVLLAEEVMHRTPVILGATDPLPVSGATLKATVPRMDTLTGIDAGGEYQPLQRLFPVSDDNGSLVGVVPRRLLEDPPTRRTATVEDVMLPPVVVYADETLRDVANLFADKGVTSVPVVDRYRPDNVVGLLATENLLHGRLRDLVEARDRERGFLLGRPEDRQTPGR